jgi:hypothetical protein
MEQLYHSGEEIHAGDEIRYAGQPGKIVFVIDRNEYLPDFPAKDWSHHRTGFMMRMATMGLVMLDAADEDLEFVARGTPTI